MKKLILAGLTGVALTFGAAQAGTVDSQLFNGFQQLSDNSAEYLINANGGNDTTLDLGDRLRGIFNIETVENLSNGDQNSLGLASPNNELAGIFDITVTSVFSFGGQFFYTFGSSGTLDAYGAGAMVAMFEDAAHEFSRLNDTIANLENNVTNGSLFWSLGKDGVDDFWTAQAGSNDIAVIGAVTPPLTGGSYNAGLSFITNNSTKTFQSFKCGLGIGAPTVDVCASGSLLGTQGVNTPYKSFDNVDFTVKTVPEPSTLALLGMALLGFSATRKRSSI